MRARARRRAVGGRARPRRRNRRARGGARGRARLRAPRAGEPERRAPPRGARDTDPPRRAPGIMIRLGRISYVNMAPVFYRLEHEVEEFTGVPTELNKRLVAGEIDIAPISSIAWARERRRGCGSCRGCASRSEGAVDSIQLVSRKPLEQVRTRGGHAGERDVGRPDEGADPRGRPRSARRGGRREDADRRRRAEERVRGSDAALRSRADVARAHRAADGVRGLRRPRAGRARDGGARGLAGRVGAPRARRARAARVRGERAVRLPGGVPRPLLREAALPVRPARARRAVHVPGDGPRRRRARARCRSCGSCTRK